MRKLTGIVVFYVLAVSFSVARGDLVVVSGNAIIYETFPQSEFTHENTLQFEYTVDLSVTNDADPSDPHRSLFADAISGRVIVNPDTIIDISTGRLLVTDFADFDSVYFLASSPNIETTNLKAGNPIRSVSLHFTGATDTFSGDSPYGLAELVNRIDEGGQFGGSVHFAFEGTNRTASATIQTDTVVLTSIPEPTGAALIWVVTAYLTRRRRTS